MLSDRSRRAAVADHATSSSERKTIMRFGKTQFAIVTLVSLTGMKLTVEKSYMQAVGQPTSPFTPYSQVTILEGTPPTPTNLAMEDLFNGQDVNITWAAPESPLITGFQIERERLISSVEGIEEWGELQMIQVLEPSLRMWVDPAGPGRFRYRIRSVNNRIAN
jgi:hypothetical protein